MSMFAQIVDSVDGLSPEEQESLVALVQRRLAARRREALIAEIKLARQEFKNGKCRAASPDQILRKILA